MATLIETPMLSVNAGKLGKVDPSNIGSVAKIWAVVSKSNQAEYLGDGPRLENLLWRTLSRQSLCNNPTSLRSIATSTVHTTATRPLRKDVPDLSTSTSTLASDASIPASSPSSASDLTASPSDEQPQSPTLSSSKGSEIFLRPLDLEKMVSSIQEKQQIEPLSPSINNAVPTTLPVTTNSTINTPSSPTVINAPHQSSDSSSSTAPTNDCDSERSTRPSISSDTSADLPPVVRGFSPSQVPSSYRSTSHLAPEALSKSPLRQSQNVPRSKPEACQKNGGFFVGGSSGEEESSFDDRMLSQPKQSSLTAGLKPKKQLSFKDIVESRKQDKKSHEDEEVFESDDEEEDDSAIDDSEDEMEDDGEWEDDAEEEADHLDRPLFKRVDSQPALVSRRSLLTTMMNQGDRAAAFQEQAVNANPTLKRSKTSNNVPTTATEVHVSTGHELLRTPAKPIMRTRSDVASLVSSPKTTRRNMLSTEIDEGLRKSILHERGQKKKTIAAYTKRQASARNLTMLSQQVLPGDVKEKPKEKVEQKVGEEDDEDKPVEITDPFARNLGNYHQSGW